MSLLSSRSPGPFCPPSTTAINAAGSLCATVEACVDIRDRPLRGPPARKRPARRLRAASVHVARIAVLVRVDTAYRSGAAELCSRGGGRRLCTGKRRLVCPRPPLSSAIRCAARAENCATPADSRGRGEGALSARGKGSRGEGEARPVLAAFVPLGASPRDTERVGQCSEVGGPRPPKVSGVVPGLICRARQPILVRPPVDPQRCL